jgi:hypothetical protein
MKYNVDVELFKVEISRLHFDERSVADDFDRSQFVRSNQHRSLPPLDGRLALVTGS